MSKILPLDRINIASPCTASWDAMSGDEKSRFCGQCSKYVYNLAAMTEAEAQQLIQDQERDLCARLYRRADGTVLTADCPVGWRAARTKFVLIGATVASLIVGALAVIAGSVLASNGDGPRHDRGMNPIAWVRDWLFPPPRPLLMEMGKICPPPNVVPAPEPMLEPPVPEIQP